MNNNESLNLFPPFEFCEIPPLFQSLELDGLFKKCCLCECEVLAEPAEPYLIERIFRGPEPIVEYAMCFRCRMCQQEGLSEESLLRLQQLWDERVDQDARTARLLAAYKAGEITVDGWTEHCVLTGKPLEECKDYQVIAVAYGRELMLSHLPVMISDDAIEEIQPLLSEQTKGWMDDFISDQFGMPPEFLECPPVLV